MVELGRFTEAEPDSRESSLQPVSYRAISQSLLWLLLNYVVEIPLKVKSLHEGHHFAPHVEEIEPTMVELDMVSIRRDGPMKTVWF